MKNRVRIHLWSEALVALGLGILSAKGDHYVAQDGQTPDTNIPPAYASWATAASNIQEAIDQAVDGSTVWVRPGTYGRPPAPVVTSGVTNMLSIAKWISVRSVSDDPADTIIDAGGELNNRCVRLYTQLSAAGNSTARLSGFTLTNGNANGGGVLFDISNWGSRTGIVDNCVIDGGGNTSGSGVRAYYTGPICPDLVLSNCVVRNHSMYGLWARTQRDLRVVDCQFVNNAPSAIYRYTGTTLIESCVFDGNKKVNANYGGAVDLWYGVHVVQNCLFHRNKFDWSTAGNGWGGAVMSVNTTIARVENCTIVSNTATGNSSDDHPGLYAHHNGGYRVVNSIMYGNYRGATHANYGGSGAFSFSNTCTHPISAYPNAGNLNADPQFVNWAGDYHLDRTSPCLNAGVNQDWMAGATDLDGLPRIDRAGPGIVDMGCYEFSCHGSSILIR